MGLDWILWLEIGDTLIFKFVIVGRRSQELYSDVHMEEERDTLVRISCAYLLYLLYVHTNTHIHYSQTHYSHSLQ